MRVDPETKLPVYLSAVSAKDNTKTSKWVFDYPSDGPSDIYALGVSRDIKIDDRMPPENVRAVLAAMAASRMRIGDFRFIIDQSPQFASSVVYRKANKWRVETWRARSIPQANQARDWDKWLGEQEPVPLFVCDGTSVWHNSKVLSGKGVQWKTSEHVAPQDLMSGEGLGLLSGASGAKFASLVYPDLSPTLGWGFEFDGNPADAPGRVLLKRSARVTSPQGAVGHEWYYLDPAKGYVVVRAELFTLPPDVPANPDKAGQNHQTMRLEEFQQSPQSFWYPAVVHDTLASLPGQGTLEVVANWHFDFDIDLPDSLFMVDDIPQK